MKKNMRISYSRALTELEKIIDEIESEDIDVDVLAEKVKKAAQLIKSCRERLRSTEDDVRKALLELDDLPSDEESADGPGNADDPGTQ
ncbi:MAG: exodeoxyribonuclease VII small subunit [Nitrospirota bacterium]|nr:exodeoxyribonuclease VII small subunit [Nitrospirota bacterium]